MDDRTPKRIVIINGKGKSGKDTFVDMCKDYVNTENYSSIDKTITINIYDTSLLHNTLIFSKPFYVKALSYKCFEFPLKIKHYNDSIIISSYRVTSSPKHQLIRVSAKQIYSDNIDVK